MLLWFIGTAVVSVWYVFRDPRLDYRLLAVGALLPDLIDLPGRQARWAHSLVVSVATLVVVMVVTAGRKPTRRVPLAGAGVRRVASAGRGRRLWSWWGCPRDASRFGDCCWRCRSECCCISSGAVPLPP